MVGRAYRIGVLSTLILIFSINIVGAEGLNATSRVNKVLKNSEDARYVLVSGEKARVASMANGDMVIIDSQGHIFKIEPSDVRIEKATGEYDNLLEDRTIKRNNLINSSFFKKDIPYVYGAVGPNSYDCSGFTYQIFKNELGIDINRVSRDQFSNGVAISKEDILPGDLVFFKTNGVTIGHVGIYIGDDEMIHASSGARKVTVSSLNSPWYKSRYAGARRLIY